VYIQFKHCLLGLWGFAKEVISLYENSSLIYLGDHFGDMRGE
jgi:hypothetical protein